MMGRPITMDQLRQEVGVMVEKITHVTLALRKIKIQIEEYVCLKVIAMLNQRKALGFQYWCSFRRINLLSMLISANHLQKIPNVI